MKVISFFTGAGGLDLGLEAAGFEIAACIECDEDTKKTISQNKRNWKVIEPGDVYEHSPEEILDIAKLKPREAFILSGGPPCQPFSKAALWANCRVPGRRDLRARTLNAFMAAVEVMLPRFVLLENVSALLMPGRNGGFNVLNNRLRAINSRHKTKYEWTVFRLNAADYGVPQIRERIFLLANRKGGMLFPPKASHALLGLDRNKETYVTTWDAIGDLDNDSFDRDLIPKGKWKDLIQSIPEGHNYLWHTERGRGLPLFGWRTRYWSFLLKLDRNKPSWTISASPGPATGPFHWRNRLLSIKELCRLQTFPDNYAFFGKYSSVRRQIGNAVPPLIGELLGKEIIRQWLGRQINTPSSFTTKRCKDKQQKLRLGRVPKKYLDLVGVHKDHPGPGKGPRALLIRKSLNVQGSNKNGNKTAIE